MKLQTDSNGKVYINTSGKVLKANEDIIPTDTISITNNGTYDVTNYANANVNVPSSDIGIPMEIVNGVYQKSTATSYVLPSGVTDLSDMVLSDQFSDNQYLTSVNFNNLTNISGEAACERALAYCTNLTSVIAGNLQNISGDYAFNWWLEGSNNVTTIDISSLETISGANSCTAMFDNTSISEVDISNLREITGDKACGQMFSGCVNLTSVSFDNLEEISGDKCCENMFSSCSRLTSLYFPSLSFLGDHSNQFRNMIFRAQGCVVHFPSNMQQVIGSWSDVVGGFGGIGTVVLFDLDATS